MPTCPTCLSALPDGADGCARCKAFAPGSHVMLTVALTPEGAPGLARFDSLHSTADAPPEPIRAPVTPHPDRLLVPAGVLAVPPSQDAATPAPGGSVASIVTTPPPAAAPTLLVKLRVIRGSRVNSEYPVYPGRNVIGRFADKPVDIDLTGVEPDGQVWSSRRHATLTLDKTMLVVEDMNSLNGTWVNGGRLRAGAALPLKAGDVIQIGVAQLRVEIEPI